MASNFELFQNGFTYLQINDKPGGGSEGDSKPENNKDDDPDGPARKLIQGLLDVIRSSRKENPPQQPPQEQKP